MTFKFLDIFEMDVLCMYIVFICTYMSCDAIMLLNSTCAMELSIPASSAYVELVGGDFSNCYVITLMTFHVWVYATSCLPTI